MMTIPLKENIRSCSEDNKKPVRDQFCDWLDMFLIKRTRPLPVLQGRDAETVFIHFTASHCMVEKTLFMDFRVKQNVLQDF